MKKVLLVLFSALVIAGCKGGGSSFTGSDGGGTFASSDSGSGGSDYSSGGSEASIPIGHNPEPATMAMFAIGLSGLAFAKSRKKKK